MDEPVLLHVITKKGKGYRQAELNPVYFHGVSSFDVDTGICRKKTTNVPSYTEVFGQAMVELAKTNDKIIAVTAAMPEGTGLVPFSRHIRTVFSMWALPNSMASRLPPVWPPKDSVRW
jgi:1-deoxy-D-xylulose-5-phosphate synthase